MSFCLPRKQAGAAFFIPLITTALLTCNIHAETWVPGTGGSWATAANWNPANVPNAVAATAVFNTPTAARTVTLDSGAGGFTVGLLVSTNDSNPAVSTTISNGTTGSNLIFDQSGTVPASVTVEGSGLGNTTISATTVFTDSVVATVNSTTASSAAGALNWTGGVSSGAGGFTKRGPGLLTFGTNNKQYTGPTLLDTDSGRTRISVAGSPTQTSSFTVNPGAQITLITAGGNYTLGTGSLNLNGTGLGAGSFPGNFPGVIRNDTNLVATITNPVVLQTDSLIHVQGAATGSTTFSNSVSGPGRLTLTAPNSDNNLGTLVLNGNNTYSGGTTIHGGTLRVSGSPSASLGTGNVLVETGSLGFAGAVAKLTIDTGVLNAVSDTATLTLSGGNVAGVTDDGFAELLSGVNEVVGGLVLGTTSQGLGTYGSSLSAAMFQNNEYFSGTGILTVIPEPGAAAMLISSLSILFGLRRTGKRRADILLRRGQESPRSLPPT